MTSREVRNNLDYMNGGKKKFIFNAAERFNSWHPILVLSLLYIFAQGSNIIIRWSNPYNVNFTIRFIHIAICVASIVFVLLKRKKWDPKYGLFLFFPILIPAYFSAWYYVAEEIQARHVFAPYNVFRIHFFVLIFLIPGPYRINFFLILAFALEAAIAWFYFDFPNLPFIALGGEPVGIIVSLVVALGILYYRYRDEKLIRFLITKEARSEVITSIARTFLSIRDRFNTPLQTITITLALLKRKNPNDLEHIKLIESNIARLRDTNKILKSFENRISSQGTELMSDKEILEWVSELKDI